MDPERDAQGPWVVVALRSRWALVSLATLLYWLASHALRPMVAVRLDELGASVVEIALVVAVWPVLSIILAVPLGAAVDRRGVKRFLVLGLTGIVITGLGFSVAAGLSSFVLLQVLSGVSELATWVSLQALITQVPAKTMSDRRAHLSLFSLAWSGGIALGPITGGFAYERGGFTAVALIHAIAGVLALLAMLPIGDLTPSAPSPTTAAVEHIGLLERTRTLAANPAVKGVMIASFMAIYVTTTKLSFYTVFLIRQGLTVSEVGFLLTSMNLAAILIRFPLPLLLRRFGAARLLLAGMWAAAVGLGLTPVLGSLPSLAVAAFVIGIGYGLNPPITVEILSVATRPTERGAAMGLRVTANRSAQIVQPLVFGGLASVFGIALAFPLSSVVLGAMILGAQRSFRGMSNSQLSSREEDP